MSRGTASEVWYATARSCVCDRALLTAADATADPNLRTKDSYIQDATSVLNDASRISPSHPPLFLARGVLQLLRASLQAPATTAGPTAVSSERAETLKQAAKCFEDALRASGGRNLMAKMGKARVSYSMGKWAEALKGYQNVLESSPDLVDPDPRIGIGCCFWQLGFKDDAAGAWQRSLDLNSKSKIALLLLGLYNLHLSSQLPPTHPDFTKFYKKATNQYIMPATKLDNTFPLTCATLGGYFIIRKDWTKVQTVARRAIDLTDVNAIASDGWHQLARKAHTEGDTAEASVCYTKSDQARGGDERGYIPAKFGSAQMNVLMHNYDGAKFRLEKILQQQPTLEAQTLLGTLYAEDVFTAQNNNSNEDKSAELKKALKYLEDVQKAWRDPKKNVTPDQSVLLNLARLYEADHPEKSLKCLEEVEQMEIDAIPEEDYPEDMEEEYEIKTALRELLPPQLLNNMGCFHFQAERFVRARELFQAALNACVKAASRDESIDTDALVTSISYNLGRCYESEGMMEEAKDVYENLLKRHADYVDARIRLTYISLRQNPNDQGPRAMKDLFKENEDNIEVRALFGWYMNKSKRKTQNFAADEEQRLYKHTLMKSDKHDRYSLMGMGNIHLAIAREMPRSSEQEKEKRRKGYERAVEFFDKVLQLDPKNAYAAQGIAIALVEDKKDYSTALQIFTKVKETLKDYSVYVNLGHTYCEIKQYARAIENVSRSCTQAQEPSR
jgi:RNA polymerase-associated protein CTR9